VNFKEGLDTALLMEKWLCPDKERLSKESITLIHKECWDNFIKNDPNNILLKNKNPFEIVSARNLLTAEPPDREWVFKRLLPKKIVAALIAAGGTGKSFMAIHMAVASASGGMFLDEFISEKPIKVVFISGEDDQNELNRRLRSAIKNFSNSYKDLVKQNLSFIDFSSSFELFTNKLSYGETSITETPAKLIKLIQDKLGDEVGLIIIDPVSRFRGGEENSAPDTTRFVQTIQLLSEQLNSTVLLVHHVNKNAKVNGTGQNNARGSSALVDGVRLVMELNALSDKEMKDQFNIAPGTKELLSLSVVKSNYGKKIMPITVEKTDDGSFVPFRQERGDYRKIEVLKKIQEKPSTKTEFRDKFGGVKKYFTLSEKALVSLLDEMEEAGLIKIPSRGNIEITELGLASLSSSGQ
jgi:RecA-family ATPase